MTDNDAIDDDAACDVIKKRIESMTKRKKIYFFMAWPLIIIGFCIVFLIPSYKSFGIGFIVAGAAVRILYYLAISELKSLKKYVQMIDNRTIVLFLSIGCLFFNSSLFGQLKRGNNALEFSGVEWLDGNSFKLRKKSNPETAPLTVVEFWATWDKASQLSIPLLSKMQKHYADKVVLLAITQENRKKVQQFLDKSTTNINFRIGLDPKGIITKKYLGDGAGFPVVFIIDKNFDILWRGGALDLEMVLEKIFNNTFDPYLLAKISALHKKLQEEMQLERITAAIETINEIMTLDPGDKLSMRVRLFLFERKGQIADAVPFIDSLIKKSPKTSSLYFVKLDIMNRLGKSPDEIKAFSKIIFEQFNDSYDVLEHLAWIAAFRIPLGTAPLGVALDSIEIAVAKFIESRTIDSAKLADYLETQARIYYLIGKIAKAVKIQERVVQLRKGALEENKSELFYNYYKKALELSNR